jgi:hypothetical protein
MSQDDQETPGPLDQNSTLLRSGRDALTFDDMGRFVKQIETRSVERLFFDLPALVRLPDATFGLVPSALRRRLVGASAEERRLFKEMVNTLLSSAKSDETRERFQRILAKID